MKYFYLSFEDISKKNRTKIQMTTLHENTQACPGCGAGVLYDDIYKCYGCYWVGCENCGFDSDGDCTVCADEEEAWHAFDDARMQIDSIDHSGADNDVRAALKGLVEYMEQWKEKVEFGEDSILCRSDGRAYDSWQIMDDCGDTVKSEAKWCLERAKALQDGSVSST